MAGTDEYDVTAVLETTNILFLQKKKKSVYSETLDLEGFQPEVREATFKLIKKLKTDGHTVATISFYGKLNGIQLG